ncbi:hypothetical protein BLNAU_17593 [Blattamonas nauphoetae]|uniref:Uncharacterized protein n=1 Tax=Blattamonas nauphoetae TaxID=2049346 RepID=A0ABQ9X6W3_9EUKA|nr:hypothetical protein BLNAU_17593 [Blattamonas nauphoetae]
MQISNYSLVCTTDTRETTSGNLAQKRRARTQTRHPKRKQQLLLFDLRNHIGMLDLSVSPSTPAFTQIAHHKLPVTAESIHPSVALWNTDLKKCITSSSSFQSRAMSVLQRANSPSQNVFGSNSQLASYSHLSYISGLHWQPVGTASIIASKRGRRNDERNIAKTGGLGIGEGNDEGEMSFVGDEGNILVFAIKAGALRHVGQSYATSSNT